MTNKTTYEDLNIVLTGSEGDNIIYLLVPQGLSDDISAWMEDASEKHHLRIVSISGMDWNMDMTPWPAPGMFKKEKAFGGGALSFLATLESGVIPHVEKLYDIKNPVRYIGGISLSGLFSIWASIYSNLFYGVISISGSLWYNDFDEWFNSHMINSSVNEFYIILGDKEHNSRDKRFSTVALCTDGIVSRISEQGRKVSFLSVPGTHFSPVIPRLQAVIDLITENNFNIK